ncbi:hypothetical protein BZG36_00045 [Bifiguratus adelaidae]|uniref:Cyclopropane-fatty-acyl-phospholipid synthase n=1 Tax=Bifiguratus adelaidae TaxID=1938954 RepID=A0A261Y888_9FUNG|nr:hypothetical protein BZG36_00045 [Bifiguratus adelaidae]
MSLQKPKQYPNRFIAYADSSFQFVKETFVGKSWPSVVNIGVGDREHQKTVRDVRVIYGFGAIGLNLIDSITHGLLSYISFTARYTFLTLLSNVKHGHLRVLSQEEVFEFGEKIVSHRESDGAGVNAQGDEVIQVTLKVIDDKFWVRLLVLSDMGFSEAYMNEEVYVDNLVGLIRLFIQNRTALQEVNTPYSSVFNAIANLANSPWVTNTLSNAMNNIQAHYDISNDMFAAFLDETMMYSCACWSHVPYHKGEKRWDSSESLYDAQLRKIHKVIELARIRKGDHVLEIGSGWGGFAIEAVRTTGCRVTSLTLSAEQKALADQRIAAAGLQDKIDILLCDYRSLPQEHQFDKVVSIEMIEAVGKEFMDTYFASIDGFLKRHHGDGNVTDAAAVLQCITMPESRYEAYSRSLDFIRKYIFPGGHLPSLTHILTSANKASKGQLVPDSTANIGPHYVRTLRLWREQFLLNFDSDIAPGLRQKYPAMTEHELNVFRRKWEYYFAYCEGGFRQNTVGVHWVVLKREGSRGTWVEDENIPL